MQSISLIHLSGLVLLARACRPTVEQPATKSDTAASSSLHARITLPLKPGFNMPSNLEARFLLDALAFIPCQDFDGDHRIQREPTLSQQMLISALEANQWIIGDIRAADLPSGTYSNRFTAWRQGDPYPNCNRTKWKYDAYDYHETSLVRPDWGLAEPIALQHPGGLCHNEADSSIVI